MKTNSKLPLSSTLKISKVQTILLLYIPCIGFIGTSQYLWKFHSLALTLATQQEVRCPPPPHHMRWTHEESVHSLTNTKQCEAV